MIKAFEISNPHSMITETIRKFQTLLLSMQDTDTKIECCRPTGRQLFKILLNCINCDEPKQLRRKLVLKKSACNKTIRGDFDRFFLRFSIRGAKKKIKLNYSKSN